MRLKLNSQWTPAKVLAAVGIGALAMFGTVAPAAAAPVADPQRP